MEPLRIYEYLVMTRERVFAAVRALKPQQYEREFRIGLGSIGVTLTHLMISEWYYIERLRGRSVPPYEQWPIKQEHPPTFEIIQRTWQAQAEQVRDVIAAEQDWRRPITWLSFPDESRGHRRFDIHCSSGDLFTQLALHEMHHRAQVLAMLREFAVSLGDIDFNELMFERAETEAD